MKGSLYNSKTLKQTFTIHLQKQWDLLLLFLFLYRFGPLWTSECYGNNVVIVHHIAADHHHQHIATLCFIRPRGQCNGDMLRGYTQFQKLRQRKVH